MLEKIVLVNDGAQNVPEGFIGIIEKTRTWGEVICYYNNGNEIFLGDRVSRTGGIFAWWTHSFARKNQWESTANEANFWSICYEANKNGPKDLVQYIVAQILGSA